MNTQDIEDVVIGSGPAGYAAALGVVARGGHPTIIDFGESPSFNVAQVERTSTVAMKGEGGRSGVFDYPRSLVTSSDGNQLPISSARGGLSRIWGAGILQRSRNEMPGLESVFDGIDDGYDALLRTMPAVGAPDRTSLRFPWSAAANPAPQSARYRKLVDALQDETSGVLIGFPRVAVDAGLCVRCGECLHGCPLDLFFSANSALAKMAAAGKCSLMSGPVLSLEQRADHVVLQLPGQTIRARRVFLGAGPIGSPSLLQRSALLPNRLVVQDSAVFYAGFINTAKAVGNEADYTSSHAVAYSETAGETDFQLALYESNPEYSERLAALIPGLGRFVHMPSLVSGHINAAIGFLDSSVSGSLILHHSHGRTWVSRQAARGLRKHALSAISRTAKATRRHGVRPVPGFVLIPPTGSGYHTGASIPMGGEFVEMNGSLSAAKSVFVVDASVLPKVWAGSHTFTAMANGYRIAKEAT